MEENQIVVDVDLAHLSESMSLELDKLGGQLNEKEIEYFTIFPVPYRFRQNKENLFEPSVVSIGPFHCYKPSLKAMDQQKWRFLRDFLSRGDHINLDLCLSEIKKLEDRTRRCYSECAPFDSNSFVEMMLLDGCFVLEYFLKWYERRINSIGQSVFILSDLLLLENQIPFFIVEKLFEISLKPDARSRRDFTNYLVNVFARAGPAVLDDSIFPNSTYASIFSNTTDEIAGPAVLDDSIFPKPTYSSIFPNPTDQIHHFVHLCYHCSIPIDLNEPIVLRSGWDSFLSSIFIIIKKSFLLPFVLLPLNLSLPTNSAKKSLMVIPCATELQNAGIKLRPKNNPNHMIDISYVLHGVLEIPRLTITNESKTLLANLIAFEQYKSDKMSANLSSFALFLDSLVNTPEDVKILQKCGIVNNCLDSDEKLSNFFNQICKGMVVDKNHFLAELFAEVNKYCKSSWNKRLARWNRHKTQFIDTYFRSPWTAISLVAAVFIVLLTCVQSFYAVFTYYDPQRP